MKKIVSLALCLAMIFSILPMGSLKLYAGVVEPEIIWLEKDYGQVGIFSEGMAAVKLYEKWGIMKHPFKKGSQKVQAQSANDVTSKSVASGQNNAAVAKGDGKAKSAVLSNAKMELNGKEVNLKAYTIGGNNYFKLRDLCEILGVKVDWNQATQTILLKTK